MCFRQTRLTYLLISLIFVGLVFFVHYATLSFLYNHVSFTYRAASSIDMEQSSSIIIQRIQQKVSMCSESEGGRYVDFSEKDIDCIMGLEVVETTVSDTINATEDFIEHISQSEVGVSQDRLTTGYDVIDHVYKSKASNYTAIGERKRFTSNHQIEFAKQHKSYGTKSVASVVKDWAGRVNKGFIQRYLKDLETNTTDVLHLEHLPFIDNLTNPCWLEKLEDSNPYEEFNHTFQLSDNRLKQHQFLALTKTFNKRIREGYPYRLRCLPSFFIIGPQKCGTTDLYEKLVKHPHIVAGLLKEPHWWSRSRIYSHHKTTLTEYVDLFDQAANVIAQKTLGVNRTNSSFPYITGEATAELIWDNWLWKKLPEHIGRNLTEVEYTTPHYIKAVLPQAKLIAMFRNPIDRLYSDYLYFGHKWQPSAHDFHTRVSEGIHWLQECFQKSSRKSCMYDPVGEEMPFGSHWHPVVRLRLGMYSEFLVDWFGVFKKEQFKIVALDDYSKNRTQVLTEMFDFLGVGPAPERVLENFETAWVANTVSKRKYSESGPMLNETRTLLQNFYRPFNERLVKLTGNRVFYWHDT